MENENEVEGIDIEARYMQIGIALNGLGFDDITLLLGNIINTVSEGSEVPFDHTIDRIRNVGKIIATEKECIKNISSLLPEDIICVSAVLGSATFTMEDRVFNLTLERGEFLEEDIPAELLTAKDEILSLLAPDKDAHIDLKDVPQTDG